MTRPPQAVRIGYFGKIAARADFIKAADNLALVTLLDQWLADVMNRLSADPRWKLHYDALAPLHFAFVGTRSRRAIAGHIVASCDQSQRRFPLMAMGALEVGDPQAFLPLSPIVLAPLWNQLGPLTGAVLDAGEPEPALQKLVGSVIDIAPDDALHARVFGDFLDSHNLLALEGMPGCVPVRRVILALGLLLLPVRASGAARLDKSLVLPLPDAPDQRPLVAAFWLSLIAPFLYHADFELGLFFTELVNDVVSGVVVEPVRRQVLVVGFGGAAPETLQAIVDPRCADEHQVGFDDTTWVDQQIAGDPVLQRLSSCLEQGRLSLRSAHALFHHSFA